MQVEELLDQLDDMIEKGWSLPGKRRVVESQALRDIVDDIRLNMPNEIKQARGIVADRSEIITSAKREAEEIVKAAEERARAMIAKEEIVQRARESAHDMLAKSQARCTDMRRAAQDFVNDLMKRADDELTQNLTDLRKTRASLKQNIPTVQANASDAE